MIRSVSELGESVYFNCKGGANAMHEVEMIANLSYPVHNRDIDFKVSAAGELLGTLKISKGTIQWVPTNYEFGFHLYWQQFANLMPQVGWRNGGR